MDTTTQPTDAQLDALRELADIGCGQAANALSRLLGGRRVDLSVPRVSVLPLGELASLLGGPEAHLVTVVLGFSGPFGGRVMLVLTLAQARQLAEILTGEQPGPTLSSLAESALCETANILASACLNAISRMVGASLLPAPPTLHSSPARALVTDALGPVPGEGAVAVVLAARFQSIGAQAAEGQLLVIPTAASLPVLLQRLGV